MTDLEAIEIERKRASKMTTINLRNKEEDYHSMLLSLKNIEELSNKHNNDFNIYPEIRVIKQQLNEQLIRAQAALYRLTKEEK